MYKRFKVHTIQNSGRSPTTAEAILNNVKMTAMKKGLHLVHIRYEERMNLTATQIRRPEKATGITMLATTSGIDTSQNVVVEMRPPSVIWVAFMPKNEETNARGMYILARMVRTRERVPEFRPSCSLSYA